MGPPRSCLKRGDVDAIPAERPPTLDSAPTSRSGHIELGERDVAKRDLATVDRGGVLGVSCRGAGLQLGWARWALLLCIVGVVEGGRWSSDGRWLPGNEPER